MTEYTSATLRALALDIEAGISIGHPHHLRVLDHADAWEKLEQENEELRGLLLAMGHKVQLARTGG